VHCSDTARRPDDATRGVEAWRHEPRTMRDLKDRGISCAGSEKRAETLLGPG
jgi:hypothetical protein